MFAAFIGGWELLLIAAVLGVMIGVPLIVVAVVLFVVNRKKNLPPEISSQRSGN
jgi:O-antigen ligase